MGQRGKSTGFGGTDRVVIFLSAIDSAGTSWLLGLDKASLRLVIGFIMEHWEVRSLGLFQIPTELLQDMLRWGEVRLSVTAERLVSLGWGPLTGASLRVWILCPKPLLRLSTDSLVAWEGWEVLGFYQSSCVLPFLFCLVCIVPRLPIFSYSTLLSFLLKDDVEWFYLTSGYYTCLSWQVHVF